MDELRTSLGDVKGAQDQDELFEHQEANYFITVSSEWEEDHVKDYTAGELERDVDQVEVEVGMAEKKIAEAQMEKGAELAEGDIKRDVELAERERHNNSL